MYIATATTTTKMSTSHEQMGRYQRFVSYSAVFALDH